MSLRQIFKTEMRYWLPMVCATYLLINGYLSGWTTWLVPDLHIPLLYTGDVLAYGVMIERQIQGFWFFENTRYGYPFIATLYDFPMAFADAIAIKVIGLVVPTWYAIYTCYVVLSFIINAVVTYVVMRAMGLTYVWALVGACLFNMLPFHFYRIGHIVYTVYACVPLAYYVAWQLWSGHSHHWQRHHIIPSAILGVVLGSFNIYYALFSIMIIGLTILVVVWRDRTVQGAITGGWFICAVAVGIGCGLLVPLWHMVTDPNTIPLSRAVEDSVRYALWPVALLTFVPDTWVMSASYMAALGSKWTEFHANSIIGSLGVVIVLWWVVQAWLGRTVSSLARFLGMQLCALIAYSAVGGGGLIVSLLATSIIRASNRFAIFAMYIGVFAVMWVLQQSISRRLASPWRIALLGAVVLVGGLVYDSPLGTTPMKYAPYVARATAWQREMQFFHDVEVSAGAGAPTYQLPALAFPEHDPVYRQTRCALYTSLACSHGNAFGRDGDLFYAMLARAPVATQLDVLARLGFTGMMIDRTYAGIPALEQAFRDALGAAPTIESADQQLAYYRLPTPRAAVRSGRSTAEVVAAAHFLHAEYALTQQRDVRVPIDLRMPWLPGSVASLTGIYELEPRGRWSNASDFRNVVLTMRAPFPRQFTLEITAQAWGRNIDAPMTVNVGAQTHTVTFGATMSTQTLTVQTDGTARTLTIIPAYRQRAASNDARFIALLIEQIRITPH